MAKTLKVLSALLSYPTEELQNATDELYTVIDGEALLSSPTREALEDLITDIAGADLYDLQERYVDLFDRGRSLSLHLFEHVHGESRDRGQAMIDLKSQYERHGLAIESGELPDFLPLFLEFLSTLPLGEARHQLGQTAHILAALAERLGKREAPYEAVFNALQEIALPPEDTADVEIVPEAPDADPSDLAALDAQWEEEAVTFGPEAAPSCKDQLIARIRAGRRPAPGLETTRGMP
ncbi:MAG: nitrate reductase molybdenum cofactor assembly chaperone [Methyloligella sp. ZOD6]